MTYNPIQLGQQTMSSSSPVVIASDQTDVPVSGTFWQATQPVSIAATVAISAASLPLPTGAATAAKQPALGTAGTASSDVITVQGIASMTALKVDGSAVTQPVSAASLPLPTGAATAAKQPALGTAGTASSDVLTVQGIASMTALKVDGSAVTQPVSGTFWQATQPVSGTITASNTAGNVASGSADSGNPVKIGGKYNSTPITLTDGQRGDIQLDSSGYLKVNIASGAAAGGTSSNFGSALPSAGTAAGFSDGTNMQAGRVFDADTGAGTQYVQGVSLRKAASGGSVEAGTSSDPLRVDPTGTTTQPISAASLPLPTGAATAAKQPTLGTAGTASSDVITVQGIASMTALKVDGSGVTQPVSGTFWQATQPVSGTVTASNTTGNIAHDSADSGNPVKIGGKARQTNPTAVTDADRVDASFDDVGRQLVVLNQCRDLVGSQTTTITSSTSETTIVTQAGAGVFADLTSLSITNSSATALIVTLKDATAGTTRGIYAIAANGGIVLTFPTPKAQSAANGNWTLTCGTSVDSVYVVAEYVKNV